MTSDLLNLESQSADEEIKIFSFSTPPRHPHHSPNNAVEQLDIFIPNVSGKRCTCEHTFDVNLTVFVLQRPKAGYSLHPWPCASILAWFLWDRRYDIADRRILEIGAGTALPGIVAAKCGAHVTLSDSCTLPKTLDNIRRCCALNQLEPDKDIRVLGLSWGLLPAAVRTIGPLDYIIASDCFYDPTVFEDILVTVAYLLERNPTAKFVVAYQVRSEDWTIEALLKKWQLTCRHVNIDHIGAAYGVDLQKLMGKHTIFMLEISRAT